MRKSLLTALLVLLPCGLNAAQPVMMQKAAGSWEGRVFGGDVKYDVMVELKNENALSRGSYSASGPGKKGKGSNGEFIVSDGELACYKAKVRVFIKPQLEFDVVACPSGPESLKLTSALGRGNLVFSNKFKRAEFTFSGMTGSTHGILYRSAREEAQGKGKVRTSPSAAKMKIFKP
jgi:hypothetical protein